MDMDASPLFEDVKPVKPLKSRTKVVIIILAVVAIIVLILVGCACIKVRNENSIPVSILQESASDSVDDDEVGIKMGQI